MTAHVRMVLLQAHASFLLKPDNGRKQESITAVRQQHARKVPLCCCGVPVTNCAGFLLLLAAVIYYALPCFFRFFFLCELGVWTILVPLQSTLSQNIMKVCILIFNPNYPNISTEIGILYRTQYKYTFTNTYIPGIIFHVWPD